MHSRTGHLYRSGILCANLLMLGLFVCARLPAQRESALVDAPTPALPGFHDPAAAPLSGAPPNPCSESADASGAFGVQLAAPCARKPLNWYRRFTNGPTDKPLTPRDKAWLAARDLVDPFNLITIGGEAAISIGADSHSPYGPGMSGYARYVGVSFTQDAIGEFFGTFAIPSLTHQDPHYHRMEDARIPRRVWHAIAQTVWTQGDSGRMMPNYANIAGFAVEDEIADLYVPGRETNSRATAERYAIGLASAPIGNFVNEFLPDVASHIHVQIVVLQRIINQVARAETGNAASGPAGDAAGEQ